MDVNGWNQSGHVYAWRYPDIRRSFKGWHMTADDAGCASIVDLLDRLVAAGMVQYRSVALSRVTSKISDVPTRHRPTRERPHACRITYDPAFADLAASFDESRLIIRVGTDRAGELRAAFIEVSRGGGDFDLRPRDETLGACISFWWMHARVPDRRMA